ncbi:hypothetical protein HPG69_013212 [Diceros bicornis minor]|uniref:G protein gamma domain-containing protein n=1 Tax=Diceros bicornis minor TaxID=77932 RepID=A0A7J7F4I5_DICBM|nr:hypothetical protein HPG69_013212 [Diceros bicornis minor]
MCKVTMINAFSLIFISHQENLARLQRAFARKWEFIFMQAEAQVKIDRKKDKTERKILDSQERAFWDVHRPVPGCVNTTEMDIRKCRRLKNPQKVKKSVYGVTEESQSQSPVHIPSQPIRKTTKEDIRKQITFLNAQIDRHCLKMSKVAESWDDLNFIGVTACEEKQASFSVTKETGMGVLSPAQRALQAAKGGPCSPQSVYQSLIAYTEQYVEYDLLITPAEPSNPWVSDDIALWDIEMSRGTGAQKDLEHIHNYGGKRADKSGVLCRCTLLALG